MVSDSLLSLALLSEVLILSSSYYLSHHHVLSICTNEHVSKHQLFG